MSGLDFELGPLDEIIEGNPLVDRGQLERGQQAVSALRRAGLTGPSYGIKSPYERRDTSEPRADVEDGGSGIIPPSC